MNKTKFCINIRCIYISNADAVVVNDEVKAECFLLKLLNA